MLVLGLDMNLVIAGESIHKGKGLAFSIVVDDLINERCRVIMFLTSFIQFMKIGTHSNCSLLLVYWNEIGYPFG